MSVKKSCSGFLADDEPKQAKVTTPSKCNYIGKHVERREAMKPTNINKRISAITTMKKSNAAELVLLLSNIVICQICHICNITLRWGQVRSVMNENNQAKKFLISWITLGINLIYRVINKERGKVNAYYLHT